MRYASVCSGIEAPSVAFEPLGWEPAFFSEIEPFPCALLEHHYNHVPNLGDMTEIERRVAEYAGGVDVFIGGTPCQSFSIAGLRGGLDDARGNLALVYMRLVAALRPRWVIWENVPGVLSSNRGRDFGAILGALEYLGYGWSYRVLDAQFFGVPQRRRRVFLVGHIGGDWRGPRAVLFERESMHRNPAPRRSKRQEAPTLVGSGADMAVQLYDNNRNDVRYDPLELAPTIKARYGTGGDNIPLVNEMQLEAAVFHSIGKGQWAEGAGSIRATGGGGTDNLPVTVSYKRRGGYGFTETEDVSSTLESQGGSHQGGPDNLPMVVAYGIRASNTSSNGWGVQEEVTHSLDTSSPHRVAQIEAYAYDARNHQMIEDLSATIQAKSTGGQSLNYINPVMVFDPIAAGSERTHIVRAGEYAQLRAATPDAILEITDDIAQTVNARDYKGASSYRDGSIQSVQMVSGRLRRLTPLECERLQGFPDGYTLIPYGRKGLAPDTPRYKALGNSMAVPVVRWIGRRLEFVDSIMYEEEESAA